MNKVENIASGTVPMYFILHTIIIKTGLCEQSFLPNPKPQEINLRVVTNENKLIKETQPYHKSTDLFYTFSNLISFFGLAVVGEYDALRHHYIVTEIYLL